jgi:hypothetical protein
MPDGSDWVMRPVLRGLCKYESLADGSLTLVDINRMNDALSVEAENNRRIQESMKQNG